MFERTMVMVMIFSFLSSHKVVSQERRPMTVEDALTAKTVGGVTISPDARWIAYVVGDRDFEENKNTTAIWLVALAGGEPWQLTRGGQDADPQWAPDGSWLLFRSTRGERAQIFGIRPTGGEAWAVTDAKSSVGSYQVAPDGHAIAYTAALAKGDADKELEKVRGRPMVWDSSYADEWSRLWVGPLQDHRAGEVLVVSPDTLHVTAVEWSPDSRRVAFAARPSPVLRTNRYGATFVVEPGQSEVRQVTFMPGGESPVAWTADLGLIVSGSGEELGTYNARLWRVPENGDPISLTPGIDDNAGYVFATATALYVEASAKTGRGLYRIPLRAGAAGGPPATVTDGRRFYAGFSISKDGGSIAMVGQSPSEPPDIFASPMPFAPKRLTNVNPQLAEVAIGETRVVRWTSAADGEEIEGVLTLPVGYRPGDRAPLLLVIHGGPSGVSAATYKGTRGAYPIHVFAGLGYAVLEPNYRGSTGYGERFRGLNRGDISGRDWVDVNSGVDAMIDAGVADPNRLGIMGWSFGGHHTYWGITQTGRFKAASAGAGANDLISMYSQTDLPEFYETYLGPRPWEDFELYEERSAYRYVERVTTPLLIQVGERDERVPAEQSIQFFEAVRAIGKAPTVLVIYPGQPHGVNDPRLTRDLMSRNVEWFQRWIPAKKVSAVP